MESVSIQQRYHPNRIAVTIGNGRTILFPDLESVVRTIQRLQPNAWLSYDDARMTIWSHGLDRIGVRFGSWDWYDRVKRRLANVWVVDTNPPSLIELSSDRGSFGEPTMLLGGQLDDQGYLEPFDRSSRLLFVSGAEAERPGWAIDQAGLNYGSSRTRYQARVTSTPGGPTIPPIRSIFRS